MPLDRAQSRRSAIEPEQALGPKSDPACAGKGEDGNHRRWLRHIGYIRCVKKGIDVAKDKRDIAVRPRGEVFGTSRDARGLDALIARLAPLSPAAVAVEATGGFETVVAASLAAAGLPVGVANPAKVRCFAQALGKRGLDRPDRRRRDRPFRRGDEARHSSAQGRSDAVFA